MAGRNEGMHDEGGPACKKLRTDSQVADPCSNQKRVIRHPTPHIKQYTVRELIHPGTELASRCPTTRWIHADTSSSASKLQVVKDTKLHISTTSRVSAVTSKTSHSSNLTTESVKQQQLVKQDNDKSTHSKCTNEHCTTHPGLDSPENDESCGVEDADVMYQGSPGDDCEKPGKLQLNAAQKKSNGIPVMEIQSMDVDSPAETAPHGNTHSCGHQSDSGQDQQILSQAADPSSSGSGLQSSNDGDLDHPLNDNASKDSHKSDSPNFQIPAKSPRLVPNKKSPDLGSSKRDFQDDSDEIDPKIVALLSPREGESFGTSDVSDSILDSSTEASSLNKSLQNISSRGLSSFGEVGRRKSVELAGGDIYKNLNSQDEHKPSQNQILPIHMDMNSDSSCHARLIVDIGMEEGRYSKSPPNTETNQDSCARQDNDLTGALPYTRMNENEGHHETIDSADILSMGRLIQSPGDEICVPQAESFSGIQDTRMTLEEYNEGGQIDAHGKISSSSLAHHDQSSISSDINHLNLASQKEDSHTSNMAENTIQTIPEKLPFRNSSRDQNNNTEGSDGQSLNITDENAVWPDTVNGSRTNETSTEDSSLVKGFNVGQAIASKKITEYAVLREDSRDDCAMYDDDISAGVTQSEDEQIQDRLIEEYEAALEQIKEQEERAERGVGMGDGPCQLPNQTLPQSQYVQQGLHLMSQPATNMTFTPAAASLKNASTIDGVQASQMLIQSMGNSSSANGPEAMDQSGPNPEEFGVVQQYMHYNPVHNYAAGDAFQPSSDQLNATVGYVYNDVGHQSGFLPVSATQSDSMLDYGYVNDHVAGAAHHMDGSQSDTMITGFPQMDAVYEIGDYYPPPNINDFHDYEEALNAKVTSDKRSRILNMLGKPKNLDDAISKYISYLIQENSLLVYLPHMSNNSARPVNWNREPYIQEVLQRPATFPTSKFVEFLAHFNIEIEVNVNNGTQTPAEQDEDLEQKAMTETPEPSTETSDSRNSNEETQVPSPPVSEATAASHVDNWLNKTAQQQQNQQQLPEEQGQQEQQIEEQMKAVSSIVEQTLIDGNPVSSPTSVISPSSLPLEPVDGSATTIPDEETGTQDQSDTQPQVTQVEVEDSPEMQPQILIQQEPKQYLPVQLPPQPPHTQVSAQLPSQTLPQQVIHHLPVQLSPQPPLPIHQYPHAAVEYHESQPVYLQQVATAPVQQSPMNQVQYIQAGKMSQVLHQPEAQVSESMHHQTVPHTMVQYQPDPTYNSWQGNGLSAVDQLSQDVNPEMIDSLDLIPLCEKSGSVFYDDLMLDSVSASTMPSSSMPSHDSAIPTQHLDLAEMKPVPITYVTSDVVPVPKPLYKFGSASEILKHQKLMAKLDESGGVSYQSSGSVIQWKNQPMPTTAKDTSYHPVYRPTPSVSAPRMMQKSTVANTSIAYKSESQSVLSTSDQITHSGSFARNARHNLTKALNGKPSASSSQSSLPSPLVTSASESKSDILSTGSMLYSNPMVTALD